MTHRVRPPAVFDNPIVRKMPQINPGDAPAASPASVTAVHTMAPIYESTIRFSAVVVPIADNSTNGGAGSLKILDWPEGLIRIIGGTVDVAITADAGISATGTISCGLGTTAADSANGTLATTEQNVIPSTAVTLAASAGAFKGKATATEGAVVIDGAATAADLFLNFAMLDAVITAGANITVTGAARVQWSFLGDV